MFGLRFYCKWHLGDFSEITPKMFFESAVAALGRPFKRSLQVGLGVLVENPNYLQDAGLTLCAVLLILFSSFPGLRCQLGEIFQHSRS